MNREIEFYKLVQSQNKISVNEVQSGKNKIEAILYINKMYELANSYEIKEFPSIKITKEALQVDTREIINALFVLESYLNEVYARNIFEFNTDITSEYLILNEDWRTKVSSYVTHIRTVVANAEISVELRESILKQLNELQSEIDRERTRLDAAVNTMLTITDAIGKGAKHLEPAAALTKKMVDAFSGLWKQSQATEPQQLPSPDKLGLPDLREEEQDSDSENGE